MNIYPINDDIREAVVDFIVTNWGTAVIVTRGKVHPINKLPGYVVMDNKIIKGIVTYHIQNHECEIVSLDSLFENNGIGSKLIECVTQQAIISKCTRVWLITTNDNTRAIRFYQKRGFNMVALHVDAIEQSRKIKPEIPIYGFDDIPILHEIEFEKQLRQNI